MILRTEFWSLICRGRKKKITFLFIFFVFLLNAMLYVSLELYDTITNKHKKSWYSRLNFDKNSYIDNTGMRVIVGHYVGPGSAANLSDEVIHSNHYAPVVGAGEGGRPVQLTPREVISARELYSLHSYNILVGDKISINRSLPDMRPNRCKDIKVSIENLPTATVIIVFHNEAWSTLMRTVMSVINRSPPEVLKEIYLVDDASQRRYLGKELEDAVASLRKVRILRSTVRNGLVGARLMGARAARGDVLVYLDAHCEVTTGWLEPLLERAGSDDVLISPHIDLISDDTFAYTKTTEEHWGAFSWGMHFRWHIPSEEIMKKRAENPADPYPTPAMAGGLFAVRRSLFWRLGAYDEGMKIWGVENLEMSWRAWQCGARLEIAPCSRVGHIFRKKTPYNYPGGVENVLSSNLARAVTVWLDEWQDFYYKFHPHVLKYRDKQDVGERVELRKQLKCKSFKWYLENVWPDHYFPTDDRWFGRIRNEKNACLGIISNPSNLGGSAEGIRCGKDNDLEMMLIFTRDGKIMADAGLCLDTGKGRLTWKHCRRTSSQMWQQAGPRLKDTNGECLTLTLNDDGEGVGSPLKMSKCEEISEQIWHFERVPWR